MARILPPLRFTGAEILRDGALQRRSLAVAEGRITKGPLPEVDMRGYLLLPGLVDLACTSLQRHVAPGQSRRLDPALALDSLDREAAAHGVTTCWLTQGWSWAGGLSDPDMAEAVLSALDTARPRLGTDLRIQLRCETHATDSADRLLAVVRRHGVGYVTFADTLTEALEAGPDGLAAAARQADRQPRAHRAALEAAQDRRHDVPRHLCRMADAFDEIGVVYGSHADPDGETRERFSMIGARIAELPGSRRAAAAARAMSNPVLLAAGELAGPGPAAGPAVRDLVADGLCDALVSDGCPGALARAAFALADAGLCTLPEAWALVSSGPAGLLRLTDRGRLDHGRRADIVAVNAESRAIEMTISGGVLTYLAQGAACRFAEGAPALAMAAE